MNLLDRLRLAKEFNLRKMHFRYTPKGKMFPLYYLYPYKRHTIKKNGEINLNRHYYFKKKYRVPHEQFGLSYNEFELIVKTFYKNLTEELVRGKVYGMKGTLGVLRITKLRIPLESRKYNNIHATILRAMRVNDIEDYQEAKKFVSIHKKDPSKVQFVKYSNRETRGYSIKLKWFSKNFFFSSLWRNMFVPHVVGIQATKEYKYINNNKFTKEFFSEHPHLIDDIMDHDFVKTKYEL